MDRSSRKVSVGRPAPHDPRAGVDVVCAVISGDEVVSVAGVYLVVSTWGPEDVRRSVGWRWLPIRGGLFQSRESSLTEPLAFEGARCDALYELLLEYQENDEDGDDHDDAAGRDQLELLNSSRGEVVKPGRKRTVLLSG